MLHRSSRLKGFWRRQLASTIFCVSLGSETRSHMVGLLIRLWMQLVSVGTLVKKGIKLLSEKSPKILLPTTRIERLSSIIKGSHQTGTDLVGQASHRQVHWGIIVQSGRQNCVAWWMVCSIPSARLVVWTPNMGVRITISLSRTLHCSNSVQSIPTWESVADLDKDTVDQWILCLVHHRLNH